MRSEDSHSAFSSVVGFDNAAPKNHGRNARYRQNAFYSTPTFVQMLSNLSEEVMEQEADDQMQFLKDELERINTKLPSAVYVPFVSSGLRNYCVLNICVEETRLFVTKSRAPFMVCLEVYRPEEFLVQCEET